MISLEEALAIVLAEAQPLPAERLPIQRALGRYLAEDLVADTDMPRFDNSSMDGFAVREADLLRASEAQPVSLPVMGVLPAGLLWAKTLEPGTAIKIMTGAPLPPGADAVVPKEDAEEAGGLTTFRRPAALGEAVRRRGEEYRTGATLLPAGIRVTPPVIGVMASLGLQEILVRRAPRVKIVVTGTELVPPGDALGEGKIYDSNGEALASAALAMGAEGVSVSHCGDDVALIRVAIGAALDEGDVVLTSGGVSVGDWDNVREAFAGLGGEGKFWRIAMKPGKPNFFGSWSPSGGRRALLFGLPGNPVGALLSFEKLVRPALLRLMGARETRAAGLRARLLAPLEKAPGRLELVRGILAFGPEGPEVTPIEARESHMLVGLARANCVLSFPADATRLEAGSLPEVHPLEWS